MDTLLTCESVCVCVCKYVLVAMCVWLCVGANKQAQTCSSLSTSNLPTVCCLLTAQQQEEREEEGKSKGTEKERKEETNKPAKVTLSDPKCQPSLLCDCQIGSTYNAVAAAAPPSLPPRPLFRLDTTSGSSSSSGSSHVT